MKRCPECGRTFTSHTLVNCLNDRAALVEDIPAPLAYPQEFGRDYSEEIPIAEFKEAQAMSPTFTLTALPFFAGPPPMRGMPPPFFAAQLRWKGGSLPVFLLLCFFGVLAFIWMPVLHSFLDAPHEETPSVPGPSTTADTVPDLFPGLKLDNTLTDTSDSTLRSSLASAIKNADAAEAKSFRTLSAAPLHSFYAGPALAAELDELQSLKQAGTVQESRMTAQNFRLFQVNPAHTKAQVDVAESWETATRSRAGGSKVEKIRSNPLVQQDLSDDISQIVTLKHTAHGWVVENIQFYEF